MSLRAGNYLETAAGVCSIHRTTLFRWLEKGEKHARGKYHDFCVAVRQAQSEWEARNQMVITKASQSEWKAAAWLLERLAPQRYGKQYNAGKREMAEQMLAQLEPILDPAKYTELLRRLQGLPSSEPPNQSATVQKLLSALAQHRNEQTEKTGSDGNVPKNGEG